ncbi:MAG: MotA/TolQ/ExbB proton channel family protein [Bacteroidales bacterium]|jgi:biopolymer transport protein ExbB|nr:MotA/TolQ/ExbB proton channel family protein [Bacteroidales bacterium]
MKKLIAFLMVAGLMTFGVSNLVVAQDEQAQTEQTEQVVAPEQTEVTPAEVETTEEITPAQAEAPKTFRESIKKQFIDGGPGFMGIVLVILLIGMAISIERIIYLTLSTANSKKLLAGIEAKMKNGDVEGAKQLCKDTRGPVASIFTQGLIRYQDGQSLEEVEKAIVSYGSVAGGKLESGLSWIGLCISLAPMFGFMGTVIGMIQAFDDIAAAGDMSPTVVASGMKVALLTTVFGLIAAIILQVFFNFIASKIESIVNDMEDASISFMDILAKYNNK